MIDSWILTIAYCQQNTKHEKDTKIETMNEKQKHDQRNLPRLLQ